MLVRFGKQRFADVRQLYPRISSGGRARRYTATEPAAVAGQKRKVVGSDIRRGKAVDDDFEVRCAMNIIRIYLRLRAHRVGFDPVVTTPLKRGVDNLPLRKLQPVYSAQFSQVVI